MSISLIGVDGINIATNANAIPVRPGTSTVFPIEIDNASFANDAFGRLRVSNPQPIFEYIYANGLIPGIWEGTAYGAGTVTQNTTAFSTELNTTTASGTGYWAQTYAHARYQSGVSSLWRHTFNMTALTTGLVMRLGKFTSQGTFPSNTGDGIYFEADGLSLAMVRRTLTAGGAGTEERVLQANWNLDKLDGTGTSGVTLDVTKAQQLVIDYQWHGVGPIRMGFSIGRKVIWAHEFLNANSQATHWARTGTLPTRVECYTTGAIGFTGKLSLYATSEIQEGSVVARPWRYFGGNSGAAVRLGGVAVGLYPLVSLRAAITNDLTKRTTFMPTKASIVVTTAMTTSVAAQWALLALPTPLTGATFAGTAGASSFVGVDQAATAATAVTGTVLACGVLPVAVGKYDIDFLEQLDSTMRAGQNAAGTLTITGANVICLAYGPLVTAAGAGASAVASINWKESV